MTRVHVESTLPLEDAGGGLPLSCCPCKSFSSYPPPDLTPKAVNQTRFGKATAPHVSVQGPHRTGATPPLKYPLPASCLQKNISLLGLPQVPKNTFNQRNEKMQKEKKTAKQDKIIRVWPLNKVRDLWFLLEGYG